MIRFIIISLQILYFHVYSSAETLEHKNGEKIEQSRHAIKKVNQDSLVTVAEYEQLLFSVFSLLQNLGADERPEVISFSSSLASSMLTAEFYDISYFHDLSYFIRLFKHTTPL